MDTVRVGFDKRISPNFIIVCNTRRIIGSSTLVHGVLVLLEHGSVTGTGSYDCLMAQLPGTERYAQANAELC